MSRCNAQGALRVRRAHARWGKTTLLRTPGIARFWRRAFVRDCAIAHASHYPVGGGTFCDYCIENSRALIRTETAWQQADSHSRRTHARAGRGARCPDNGAPGRARKASRGAAAAWRRQRGGARKSTAAGWRHGRDYGAHASTSWFFRMARRAVRARKRVANTVANRARTMEACENGDVR